MDRNKKLAAAASLLLIAFIVVLFLSLKSTPKKTQPVTYTDKQTGATFYTQTQKDPVSDPTSVSSTLLAFIGSDKIVNDITENQFDQLRSIVSHAISTQVPSATMIKFDATSIIIDQNNNISATFTTDKSPTQYSLALNIASINSMEVIIKTASQPPTTLLDTGYIDTSTTAGDTDD